jgi:hypothetical protein
MLGINMKLDRNRDKNNKEEGGEEIALPCADGQAPWKTILNALNRLSKCG